MRVNSEYESGYVYEFSDCSVYVAKRVDDPDEAATMAADPNRPLPDAATRIESVSGDLRSASEKAELLALLYDRADGWAFEHADVDDSSAKIPVQLAVEGKATIASYLAVHGLSNEMIANQTNVGKRTVSQYISDFRSGER